jgi:type III secretion system YscQ/HrcQ family protein
MTHLPASMRTEPPGTPSARKWQPPRLTLLEAELAAALGTKPTWTIAGVAVRLAAPVPVEDAEIVSLRIGGAEARLVLPRDLLARVLGGLDPAARRATGEAARLLLALALEEALQDVERVLPALAVELQTELGATLGDPGRPHTAEIVPDAPPKPVPPAAAWDACPGGVAPPNACPPGAPVSVFVTCMPADGFAWPARLELKTQTARHLLRAAATLKPFRQRRADLKVPVALRIGGLALTCSELRRLRQGCVILADRGEIDTESVLAVAAEHLCWHGMREAGAVRITSRRLPVRVLGTDAWTTGATNLSEERAIAESGQRAITGSGQRALAGADGTHQDAPIDDLPVRLVFELGQVELTLSELESVGPGYVFMPRRNPEWPIDLVVNGRRIGQGEIIAVGDTLGVRVVRINGVG